MVSVTKEGTRTVNVSVPYTETIQVPVAAPATVGGCDNGMGASGAGYGDACGTPAAAECAVAPAKMGLCGRLKGMFSRKGGCN